MACRVIFEANVGDRITSHLNICNDGTTAIYFSWKVWTAGIRLKKLILPGNMFLFQFLMDLLNSEKFQTTFDSTIHTYSQKYCSGAFI